MAVVQELRDRDTASRSALYMSVLIGIFSDDAIILKTAEAHFHVSGAVATSRIFGIG
jgi:hypothetical protein